MTVTRGLLRMIFGLMRRISLWAALAIGIVILAVWDGAGYVVKSNSIAVGPVLAFLRSIPGGMRTHGVIMLILAAAIIYTMHDRKEAAKWVMWIVFLYSVAISCAMFYGWYISHAITWSAPSKWFLVIWVSLVMQTKIDDFYSIGRTSAPSGD